MSKEIKPKNPGNWLVDVRSKREKDGKYTDFYHGITLSSPEKDEQYFEEVTPEWKEENEYKEPEPEVATLEPKEGE